jgi:hypothetical protein
MNEEKIKKLFSEQRFRKFSNKFPDDFNKALDLYKLNISVSKSFYPLLSIIEITLRNRIYFVLSKKSSSNWTEIFEKHPLLIADIENSKNYILKRKEQLNDGKLLAELTFGFWTKIFNSRYEVDLWKPLRLVFSNMPKKERQRRNISAPLNKIRDFRNRVFHYEPIIWNVNELNKIKQKCYKLLEWLDQDLPSFVNELENIDNELQKLKELYDKNQ